MNWRKDKKLKKADLRLGSWVREELGYSVSGAHRAYRASAKRRYLFKYLGWREDYNQCRRLANQIQ